MRLPLLNILSDASSTAANHDPGATLRRLRPPYHAVRLGETDRGDLRLQSNRELTLCSACVYLTALLNSSPTESTVSRSKRRSGTRLIVSVTTTSVNGAALSRSIAGPLNTACVAQT